jgi:hypothetical protein
LANVRALLIVNVDTLLLARCGVSKVELHLGVEGGCRRGRRRGRGRKGRLATERCETVDPGLPLAPQYLQSSNSPSPVLPSRAGPALPSTSRAYPPSPFSISSSINRAHPSARPVPFLLSAVSTLSHLSQSRRLTLARRRGREGQAREFRLNTKVVLLLAALPLSRPVCLLSPSRPGSAPSQRSTPRVGTPRILRASERKNECIRAPDILFLVNLNCPHPSPLVACPLLPVDTPHFPR